MVRVFLTVKNQPDKITHVESYVVKCSASDQRYATSSASPGHRETV